MTKLFCFAIRMILGYDNTHAFVAAMFVSQKM